MLFLYYSLYIYICILPANVGAVILQHIDNCSRLIPRSSIVQSSTTVTALHISIGAMVQQEADFAF